MTDLSELEQRITAALDRIASGVDTLSRPAPGPDPDTAAQLVALQAELADERAAKVKLEARVAELESVSLPEVALPDAETAARVAALEAELAAEKEARAALERQLAEATPGEASLAEAGLRAELDQALALKAKLEARLTRLEPAAAPEPDAGATAELSMALEAEKAAKAELEERLGALESGHAAKMAELQQRHDAMIEQSRDMQERVRGLRRRIEEMRQAMQIALEKGGEAITDPHLVNRTMMAELEGLRALREADRTELDVLLGALKPLVKEGADA